MFKRVPSSIDPHGVAVSPTGFESTCGYWTDHLLNHKQSMQIISDKFEIYNVITF